MTTYTRTVSGIISSTPAWFQAMSSANTVYSIGEPSSVLESRIQWPGGVDPKTHGNNAAVLEYGGSDNNAWYMMAGFGSSIYVPELGAYGSMVFTGTGEHALSEAHNIFALSLDNPTWNFYQHPQYSTSLSEAIANNADAYFNVADYNASVSAGRYITYGSPDTVNWNRATFPVGFGNGWVLRQKYGTNGGTLIGKNVPHWGRYNMPGYIPPSMTGAGAGAILTNSQGTIYGPFNSGPIPPGESDATFYAEVWPGGARKHWLHAMNVQTRQWTRLATPVPQNTANFGVAQPHAGVDVERKRVYYTANSKIYYADFTNGLAGMTFTVSNVTESATADNLMAYTACLCIVTSGPNAGKRLWYSQYVNDVTNQLVLLDVDALTIRRLAVPNLPTSARTISYDAANNMVYMVGASAGGSISCCRFQIPTNYASGAAYSVEQLPINMNGNSISSGYQLAYQGHASMVLPTLGVIMVPQKYGRMLAFRPA